MRDDFFDKAGMNGYYKGMNTILDCIYYMYSMQGQYVYIYLYKVRKTIYNFIVYSDHWSQKAGYVRKPLH